MKTFITILVFLLGFAFMSHGQSLEKQYKDRVVLTNGSVVYGAITEIVPNERITIELKAGNTLNFPIEHVKKFVMHTQKESRTVQELKSGKLYNESQLSLLSGVSGTGISFSHSVLLQFHKYAAVGLGIGVDNYYLSPGRDIFPLFGNVKVNWNNKGASPYIGLKAGYGFAFKNESENIFGASGGFMTNPYFGIRTGSGKIAWNLFLGFKFQKADYEIIRSFETRSEDILFKRLEIGTSIMF